MPQTSRDNCGRHPRSRENSQQNKLQSRTNIPQTATVRLSAWHMPTPRACSGRHKYAPIAKVSRKAVTRGFLAAASASSDELYVDMVNPKSFDALVNVSPNLRVLWGGTTDSRRHGHQYLARCGRNYVRL